MCNNSSVCLSVCACVCATKIISHQATLHSHTVTHTHICRTPAPKRWENFNMIFSILRKIFGPRYFGPGDGLCRMPALSTDRKRQRQRQGQVHWAAALCERDGSRLQLQHVKNAANSAWVAAAAAASHLFFHYIFWGNVSVCECVCRCVCCLHVYVLVYISIHKRIYLLSLYAN